MADAPGEFMMHDALRLRRPRPFRARPVRSVLTHCLQDLSTKLIPSSHNCSMISPSSLDLIIVALSLFIV